MLRFMRKYATGYLVKALFGVIIIVFIFWGVGSFNASEKVVAEVGPHKIFFEEYQEAYNSVLNTYRRLYKDKFDEKLFNELKLKEKVMDEIINKHILLLKAKDLGVRVSDEEFNGFIGSIDAFKRDGKFSQDQYMGMLKRNNLDPKKFEESEKAALVVTKISAIIRDNGIFFNEADLWKSYVEENGKVNLSYVQFDPSDFKNKVSVDENEIQGLYDKEKGAYKGENLYRLKYIVIDDKSSVKDDAAYMDLLKLNDIDVYGERNGLQVVDTGTIKESELLNKFKGIKIEEWVKGLKKGDISLPARDNSKSYIFKLIDVENGRPFDKAIIFKDIKEKIAIGKTKIFAKAIAEETIGKKNFSSKNETGFIRRNTGEIPKIGPIPRENIDILALSKDNAIYNKPVEISGKYYIFSFKDEKKPEKQEWEKNKKDYANYVMAKKKAEYFKFFMDNLKKKEKIEIHWKEL